MLPDRRAGAWAAVSGTGVLAVPPRACSPSAEAVPARDRQHRRGGRRHHGCSPIAGRCLGSGCGAGAGATGIGGAARGVGGGALGRGTGGRAAAGGTGGADGAWTGPPTAGKPMMVRLAVGRGALAAGGAAVTPGSGGAGRLAGAGVGGDTPGISDGLLPVLGGGAAAGAGRAPGQVGGRPAAQAAGPAAELRSMVNSP